MDSDDEEGPWMDENKEEESSDNEENEVVVISEDKAKEEGNGSTNNRKEAGEDTKPEELEGDHMMDDRNKMGDNTKPVELKGDNTMDDTHKTEEVTELVHGDLKQEMPGIEIKVHRSAKEATVMDEHLQAGIRVHTEHTEVETENLVETKETSQHGQGSSM